MPDMLKTFNSRCDRNGNSRNLVVNITTMEMFFHEGHVMNKGIVYKKGIREVEKLYKSLLSCWYSVVPVETAYKWEYKY